MLVNLFLRQAEPNEQSLKSFTRFVNFDKSVGQIFSNLIHFFSRTATLYVYPSGLRYKNLAPQTNNLGKHVSLTD